MAHHGCSRHSPEALYVPSLPSHIGTDLQKHGTMKDAQTILRHKHIKTTAQVYMDHIPDSVSRAIEARTDAIFALRNKRQGRKSTGVLLNIAGQSKGKVSVN
jgi:hypothetical protein